MSRETSGFKGSDKLNISACVACAFIPEAFFLACENMIPHGNAGPNFFRVFKGLQEPIDSHPPWEKYMDVLIGNTFFMGKV